MGCARPNVPRSNPKDLGELDDDLLDCIWTMMQYAPSKGLVLVSGYRDPGRQWDLRHERCRGMECDSRCKGHPTTALPGKSNHGRRKAADLGGRDLDWAYRNRARFGLKCPVPGEKWHFEKAATPCQVPIIRYPGRRWNQPAVPPKPVDPNAGRKFRTFAKNATDPGIYAAGGRNDQVVGLEMILQSLGYYKGAWDGIYGPKLLTAYVKAKQDLHKLDPRSPLWKDLSSNVTEGQYRGLEAWVHLKALGSAPRPTIRLAA